MALIDKVKKACDRLADSGWRDFLKYQGIDIKKPSATALAKELAKSVTIKRDFQGRPVSGLGDFLPGKTRAKGIDPGDPSGSILYHAFASANVQSVPGGGMLADFPTFKEIDDVENYVFGVKPPTLSRLKSKARRLLGDALGDTTELAIGIFATEYRPAPETPHRKHADLCFSRTGVARVGTIGPNYNPAHRGYSVFTEGDNNHDIRVLPCRYAAYIAVKSKGRTDRFGPMRADGRDGRRNFWVPLHKLFDGDECLDDIKVKLGFELSQSNQKIARLHQRLESQGEPIPFPNNLDDSPFVLKSGIAHFDGNDCKGAVLLVPDSHRLVEPTEFEEEPLAFRVPRLTGSGPFTSGFSPSMTISAPTSQSNVSARPWPEYAHVRIKVDGNQQSDLNDFPDVASRVSTGRRYDALNFTDFAGDGFVTVGAKFNGTAADLEVLPAYSMVTAPDFYPAVEQRDVQEWWENATRDRASLPDWFQKLVRAPIWQRLWLRPPLPLSDLRQAANLQLSQKVFDRDEKTITTIVSLPQKINESADEPEARKTRGHAFLPDGAAGIFAPGWDTSNDYVPGSNERETHLAAYGLGTPFPEDAKLCAALSTFWPAVAPDTARTFVELSFASICPLTDAESGVGPGGVPWDGVDGPRVIGSDGDALTVEYPSFDHADYTLNALDGKFSIALTSSVTFREYTDRVLAMLRCYSTLGVLPASARGSDPRGSVRVLSFSKVALDDAELAQAQRDTGKNLMGQVYRFVTFAASDASAINQGDDHRIVHRSISDTTTVFVGSSQWVLKREKQGDGTVVTGDWMFDDV